MFKKISFSNGGTQGVGVAASVLNQWENEGKSISKWELSRVVKELRKFRRFKLALEVYEWINNREERFRTTPSDTAIQLDLISKVHGISEAESYFQKLPAKLKDKRTYGSLLNAYVQARERERAESLLEEMRGKGYAMHPLPFNVMMTLYMSVNEYDKVQLLVSEMKDKKIPLDLYSYNIWLSSCGSEGSTEKMEHVFKEMENEGKVNPNWTTFSSMATMYIKLSKMEKAEECLKKFESRISGGDRMPYHYLVSLYGSVGKKDEVYRVWNIYRSLFQNVPNLGYHAMISSLVRLDDIDGAEKLYEEWLSVRSTYDPRIVNLLMSWYVKNELLEKAENLFNQMVQSGGKPNSTTWEIRAEVKIKEKQLSNALSCLKEAVLVEGSTSWKPKSSNVTSILKLCEEEDDVESKGVLMEVLRQVGCLEDEVYMTDIRLSDEVASGLKWSTESGKTSHEIVEEKDVGGSEMVLTQLQGSL